MNSVTSKIKVDFLRPEKNVVKLTRDDAYVRKFEISLYAGGQAYEPDDNNVLYAVYFTKPDGTTGGYDTMPDNTTAAVTRSGNVLTVKLAPQVTTVPGHVKFGVALYKASGDKLQTFDIDLLVEDSAGAGEISNNYWNLQSLAGIQAAVSALEAVCVDFTGATSSTTGVHGLVPAPAGTDRNKVLKGNGGWSTLTAADIAVEQSQDVDFQSATVQGVLEGLAEAIQSGPAGAVDSVNGMTGEVVLDATDIGMQSSYFQNYDNVQEALEALAQSSGGTVPVMQPASSGADGAAGLVPKPLQNEQDKVLKGSGWGWLNAGDVGAQTVGNIQAQDVQGVLDALELQSRYGYIDKTAAYTSADPASLEAYALTLSEGAYYINDTTFGERIFMRIAMLGQIRIVEIRRFHGAGHVYLVEQYLNGTWYVLNHIDTEEGIVKLAGEDIATKSSVDTLITQVNAALAQVVGGGSNA